jgi:hypothetical protein
VGARPTAVLARRDFFPGQPTAPLSAPPSGALSLVLLLCVYAAVLAGCVRARRRRPVTGGTSGLVSSSTS